MSTWEFGTIRNARDGAPWLDFRKAVLDRDTRADDRILEVNKDQFSVNDHNRLVWQGLDLLDYASEQILNKCGISGNSAQQIMSAPDIAKECIDRFFESDGQRVRLYNNPDGDTVVRGFVSPSYQPIPGSAIVGALEQTVDTSNVRLSRYDIGPLGFDARAIDITSEFDVNTLGDPGPVPNDVCYSGWDLSTSDVGLASAKVASMLFRLVCNNGSTTATRNALAKMIHKGRKINFKGQVRNALEWQTLIEQAKSDKFLLPTLDRILENLSVLAVKPTKGSMVEIYNSLGDNTAPNETQSEFARLLEQPVATTLSAAALPINRWDLASAFALAGGKLHDPKLEQWSADLVENEVVNVFPTLLNIG